MPIVQFGNSQAIDHSTQAPIAGRQITTSHIDPCYPLDRAMLALTHDSPEYRGAWRAHSTAPRPDWVESDSPELAAALSAHFGCPIGRPADWDTDAGPVTGDVPLSPVVEPAPPAVFAPGFAQSA